MNNVVVTLADQWSFRLLLLLIIISVLYMCCKALWVISKKIYIFISSRLVLCLLSIAHWNNKTKILLWYFVQLNLWCGMKLKILVMMSECKNKKILISPISWILSRRAYVRIWTYWIHHCVCSTKETILQDFLSGLLQIN